LDSVLKNEESMRDDTVSRVSTKGFERKAKGKLQMEKGKRDRNVI